MYHYIRDFPNTRYPRIPGLLLDKFLGQLSYLEKYYTFVNVEACIDHLKKKTVLPKNACLLTFDDGYIDHFITVFPILSEKKIPAAFFPPALPIVENKILDVHKIHYILASTSDYKPLVEDIFSMLDYFRPYINLPPNDEIYSKLSKMPSRFDIPEVVFIKMLLQHELPVNVRYAITNELFKRYVKVDEKFFVREIYMSMSQLKMMQREGMYIGGHGYHHEWMGKMSEPEQSIEFDKTRKFLEEIHKTSLEDWVFCYPSGSKNDYTVQRLKELDCAFALGTKPTIAPLDEENRYCMPRLDTNDLPFVGNADLSKWTRMVIG